MTRLLLQVTMSGFGKGAKGEDARTMINDNIISTTDVWSSSKTNEEINKLLPPNIRRTIIIKHMRTLIKGYTFTAGTRSIDCSNCNPFDIENIRLIVNETKKVVICSSMQKDLIVSIVDGVITYAETLPAAGGDGDKGWTLN